MNYLEIANSPWIWLACGLCVGWVLMQSILFVRKSLKVGKQIGVTVEQIKSTVKVATVTSLGPSLGIVVGMVALLLSLGGPIAWYRLSYIGSVAYETTAAELGAQAAGEALGALSPTGFATAVWTMILGAMGAPILTGLFTHKMDKLQNLMAGGKREMLPVISGCCIAGVFAFLTCDRVFRFDPQTAAALVGFAAMALFSGINKKAKKKWIHDWGFTLSMFIGMGVSMLF